MLDFPFLLFPFPPPLKDFPFGDPPPDDLVGDEVPGDKLPADGSDSATTGRKPRDNFKSLNLFRASK